MKKTIKNKYFISLIAVLILLVSITATSAFALPNPQRMKAGIAAAITAINIAMNSAVMPVREMIEYVGDPLDYQYTYAEAFNDRPQIQIWDDYIEIDGEQYTDIWISNEAAEKFRVNAFDFKSAYNIASNSNGTFASGTGDFMGLPTYNVDGKVRTQNYEYYSTGTYNQGTGTFAVNSRDYYDWLIYTNYNNSTYFNNIASKSTYPLPMSVYYQRENNGTWTRKINETLTSGPSSSAMSLYHYDPFDFDYVSSVIPPDDPLPEDTGMMIRIPSYDPNGNKYLEPFLVDNPEFDNDEPVTIDVNIDPDIMTKLDDLFDIIVPIIPVINNNFGDVQFIENHEAPVPVPDVPIVDATVPQVVNPIINEITNYGDQITEQIPNIIESIPNISEICNNIDTAPYNDLDTGLDRLPTFFLPFITDLRSALGIWHYVTEWLAQISTTFAFVSGCLVGTSIMTPIYAAIAGFMCIKIYRRITA